MPDNDQISLSFFPITEAFAFQVYRKEVGAEDRREADDIRQFSLPRDQDPEDRAKYWISLVPRDGFETFECSPKSNNRLTVYYLGQLLADTIRNLGEEGTAYINNKNRFSDAIFFVLRAHTEGWETVRLEPYYLAAADRFGFLADFGFVCKEAIPFSRRVQQLSLSLDRQGRSNKNFYADKYDRLMSFSRDHFNNIFPLQTNIASPVTVSKVLQQLPAQQLTTKTYLFRDARKDNSQYRGIKDIGPVQHIGNQPTFYFLYEQKDHAKAQDLYRALHGDSFPGLFPGLEAFFGINLSNENVQGIEIPRYSQEAVEPIAQRIQDESESPFPILIAPERETAENKQAYTVAKHIFVSRHIPMQVVTRDTLQTRETLKWSVANIALQIFCKLGGIPWTVEPRHENCLIIGIGQAHDKNNAGQVVRYLAYSVLTDSSGLYKELRELSRNIDKDSYLRALAENLRQLLDEASGTYERVVIHAPFKLKKAELDQIRQAIEGLGDRKPEIVVLKVNTKNRFFGYSTVHNSLVPYESTFVRLAPSEFLVWFEGLQYHNPTVRKRYANPVHISFEYATVGLSPATKQDYLQDALNLSGANWRGFNAKSLPVSIFYCQLVARFLRDFDSFQLPSAELNDAVPWFL